MIVRIVALIGAAVVAVGLGLWLVIPQQSSDVGAAASTQPRATGNERASQVVIDYFAFLDAATRSPRDGWDEDDGLKGLSDVATGTEAWHLEGLVADYAARNVYLTGEWATTIVDTRRSETGGGFVVDVCRDPARAFIADTTTEEKYPAGPIRKLLRLQVEPSEGWRVTRFTELLDEEC